ncbi:MAG: hypothetical protein HFJ28_05305 [Clostridia bacterium]|nr:hypothetical protein [Clostridia bacterium]
MNQDYVEFRQGNANNPWPLQKVTKRSPEEIAIPDGYVALRFVSKELTIINGKEVRGQAFNQTGWYYRGKEAKLEEVKDIVSEEQYQKLQKSGCQKVAITKEGVFPLWAIDQVMES